MLILSIAMPRTGSSKVSSICLENNICYISEAFFPGKCRLSGKNKISKEIKDYFVEKNMSKDADNFNGGRLLGTYKALEETSKFLQKHSSVFIVEIFPKHLSLAQIQSLMSHCSHFVLILRPLIDSYISLTKARKSSEIYGKPRWGQIDTSNIKTTLSAKNFLEYVDNALDYYRLVFNNLTQNFSIPPKKFVKLDYQKWEALEEEDQQTYVTSIFRDLIPDCANPEYASDFNWRNKKNLFKQDRSKNWTSKISNPSQFSEELIAMGFNLTPDLNPWDMIDLLKRPI